MTKYVLVLCHPRRNTSEPLLKIISKRILNENDRDDDIILEFMSKPEERLLIDTEYMNTYYVDYLSFFDEKDNDLQKGKYSLIIMNTCPFVSSPHLNNENVVKKLTEVLIPNGYIVFSGITDGFVIIPRDIKNYEYIRNDIMRRFNKNNYFLKNFEQIEIPTEFVLFNKNLNNLKTVRLSSLNSSTTPALKYRVFLLFQLKDINIKENNETSNARSSSETTNNARPMSTSARSNSETTNNARPRSTSTRSNSETTNKARPRSTSARSNSEKTNIARPRSTSARSNSETTNNARPRSTSARSNSEKTNNARPRSTSAKGGKKLKTRKKYNNKQIL